MAKKIEKLIIKYLTNSATVTDLDVLSKWIEDPSNKKVFKDFVQTQYVINYSMNDPEAKVVVENLLKTIRKEKSLVFQLKRQPIYKYVVAASVILFLTITFFWKKTNKLEPNEPTIVNVNIIEPGTDKATLTLEDGSQVVLEKGAFFKTQNANSNGEEIIYEANTQKTKSAYNFLTIPRGGQFYVKLSDGTQVWLNSDSQLKYPTYFIEGELRQVELVYGEAYFDVSPSSEHNGAKFKVVNRSQEVEVLGTEFNIKAYKDEVNIYTTLVEGKVSIGYNNKKQYLNPSQQSNLNIEENQISVASVNVYNEISWKEGVFSFRKKSLEDIMKVLSRWYDIDVSFENPELKKAGFNGVLGKDQSIEDILEIIKSFGVIKEYELKNRKVVVK
ncbi:DUF4974 domain-containing protein [Flaviramulus aquimarinus]|uniref:DUF4974 domain-containing protein n=1 Tax=Flaviramulus aquimarinus TaxID=1170456 RepID=A0ABP9EXZ4_9FLAO